MAITGGLFSEPEKVQLTIRNNHDEFSDDPSAIRWRAWWEKDYSGNVIGIILKAYPVVRETPKGAWIDPLAYRNDAGAMMMWSQPYKELLRWVSNDGGAAWAKKTKGEALDSLAIRYQRWANRILGDVGYFIDASRALEKLMPDKVASSAAGLAALRAYVASNA